MRFYPRLIARADPERARVQLVDVDRSARAEYLQRVLPFFGRMRNRHGRTRPALELEQHRGRVLDSAIEHHVGGDGGRPAHGAEQMHQHFQAVAAEVHHRAPAGPGRIQQPSARVARCGIEILEGVHLREDRLPDVAGLQHRLDAQDHGIEMTVIGDAQPDVMRAAGRDHAIAFRRGHRHRLLAQDMLAGFGGRDRLLCVDVHRRRDVDAVHIGIRDELLPARIPSAGADVGGKRRRQLGASPADGHDVARRRVDQRRRHSSTHDVARANQAPTNGFGVHGSGFGVRSGSGFD